MHKLLTTILIAFAVSGLDTASKAATTINPNEQKPATSNQEKPVEPVEKVDEIIPFCSKNFLLKSDFIRTSVWPGIGPFDPVQPQQSEEGQSIQFADPAHNQLDCATSGNDVHSCQLEIHNTLSEAQGLLNLQMGTDFLLEGLGVKAKQIHIVNMELSKKSKLLTGNNYNPVSVIIAPITVTFQNLGKKENTNSPLYRVVVLNQAAEKTGASEEVASAETNKSTEVSALNSPAETEPQISPKVETIQETKPEIAPIIQATEPQLATPPNTEEKPPAAPVKAAGKDEALKKQFADLIANWQHIKKSAVKEHQTNELSQVLAGKALVRQSDAIKWLSSNHKSYDMISQTAKVEQCSALTANKKYAVFVEVKEKSIFIDDTTKKHLKESDDTYKVNYTIEKIGAHWLITDSTLIKQGAKKPGSKPVAKSAH